jgi:tetratricopeptide (TPR) repeat protein
MSDVRRRLIVRCFAVLACALVLSPAGRGADEDSWVGRKIVLTRDGVKIGHGGDDGRPVYVADLTDIAYTVLLEDGGWLCVRQRGAEGWFAKTDAVLLEDAAAHFTARIQANARDALAYAHRGRAWKERGDWDRALKDYDDAIRLFPRHPTWWRDRGVVHEERKDYDQAVRDFSEAIRLNPQDPLSYLDRGIAHKGKKDYDKAVADYTEAIRLDPAWAHAYYNRANAHGARKDYDKAIADYGEAIRLDPKDSDAYFNRANAYKARKEYDKAVADYTQAIRLDPNDPDAYDSLAWILATCPDARFRDGAKAVDYAGTACELTDARSAYFMATLAAAFAELGKFDQAVKWQRRALESPDYQRDEGEKARQRLKLFEARKPYREE